MSQRFLAFLLLTSSLLVQGPALAGKPEWVENGGGPGNSKGHGNKKHAESDAPQMQPMQQTPQRAQEVAIGNYFQEMQRQAVASYYGQQQAAGKCPPGLAKKNNGCMPPGQAKQWQRGKVLPGSVMQYPVPPEVLRRMGNPPPGYKFIRVANDILLIAVGTQMVVDAIEDLMR